MGGRVITKGQGKTARQSRQINIVLSHSEPSGSHEPSAQFNGRNMAFHGNFSEVLKELDEMVGLDNVKELIYEIYALLQVEQYRTEAGLLNQPQVFHMIFRGNPGTGKTTVARIIAKMLHKLGVLGKGHFIEVERADLVGEYIGHTALKTRELVKKSLGGILFIDEAYSLARGGEKDFGKEAIDTLVKAMEDYKNQFVLILAGYCDEMEDFLQTNPGLPSRFPIQLDFQDYSIDQLIQIAELMIKEREYSFVLQTVIKLRQHIIQEQNRSCDPFNNARYVRNLIEQSIRHQAVRLLNQFPASPSKQELMIIRPEDLRIARK